MTDYQKWLEWAYKQIYGEEMEEGEVNGGKEDFSIYSKDHRLYWSQSKKVGVIERDGKYIGVACLAAKEVVDKENFVRRFGLSFEKEVYWKGIAGLLEHLSRSPLFKAVLITTSNIPFKLEPDVPEKLEGRLKWAERNYNFHKSIAERIKKEVSRPVFHGPIPSWLPKQLKEEQEHAKKYLELAERLRDKKEEVLRRFFKIKDNLIAVGLFLYFYTAPHKKFSDAVREITSRLKAAKLEARETYFVRCVEVDEPLIVFGSEFFPGWEEIKPYYNLALTNDVHEFKADVEVGTALSKMFSIALEVPEEEEEIHVPGSEVSVKKKRSAFIGYVVKSVIRNEVTDRKVYFPLDVLTSHAIIYGKTRSGKSSLAIILIREALKNGVRVVVFDPHGTLRNNLEESELLTMNYTRGRADITRALEEIYNRASNWEETNELRLLVVLDETRLLKARNLIYCINELGKRGVGFILITQYSTSIPPELRNVGTYFIMSVMSERELQRFKDITVHPSAKLLTRLPRAMSMIFSPYWYPEPFFIRHRMLESSLCEKKREKSH